MKMMILHEDTRIMAAVTLRDEHAPRYGSMALHTGEDPQAIMANP